MSPLRVGRIAALNMFPVYHRLEAAADAPDACPLSFTDGPPTALNRELLVGRLDVSAMSSIAYARDAARLRLLPVASITAAGAVDSIGVFSRVPFARVRTVAVTPHSATSVTLLRVLLGEGVPPFEVLAEPPADALRRVDAVLLIGDEALAALRDPPAPHHTDLAERWHALTGEPMVFAVWAARLEAARTRPEALDRLAGLLRDAGERHRRDPGAAVAAAAARFPFPESFIRGYLARLSYDFGPAERTGLSLFLQHARAAGELDALPRLAAA